MSHFLLIVAVIGVLYVANVVNNRLVDKSYLLICFVATAVLILIARLDGLSWTDLGLGHSTWVQGLIWSAWVALAVLAFYAIAASIPATRKGFGDKRAAEQSLINLCYESMIRIPLGTALLEEVAFRAVLLAVVWAEWGQWWGVGVSAVHRCGRRGLLHVAHLERQSVPTVCAARLPQRHWRGPDLGVRPQTARTLTVQDWRR